MSELLRDAAGRRRSPATLPEFHADRPPRNKGKRYPADPPTIEEIIAVMRRSGDGVHGRRVRGLIVVLWRADLRICEALALAARPTTTPRRGQDSEHGPGTTRSTSHLVDPAIVLLTTTCGLASHDEFRASTPTIDCARPCWAGGSARCRPSQSAPDPRRPCSRMPVAAMRSSRLGSRMPVRGSGQTQRAAA
jgi:hypothetical protein